MNENRERKTERKKEKLKNAWKINGDKRSERIKWTNGVKEKEINSWKKKKERKRKERKNWRNNERV